MRYALLLILALAACKQEAASPPEPVTMSAEAIGYYCQMNLLEHPGPKGQVHLEGLPGRPLFFSQVRDAIAYQRMPEQDYRILGVYVSDMGAPGATWAEPGAANWILADTAHYVMGSARQGGMGAPELVPFSDPAKARAFAAEHGGTVVALDQIADSQVLAPVEVEGDIGATDDVDFEERLRKLSDQTGG